VVDVATLSSFVLRLDISQCLGRRENIHSLVWLLDPALLYNVHHFGFDETPFLPPWVDKGPRSANDFFLDRRVVVGIVEYPEAGQEPIDVVAKRKHIDLLVEVGLVVFFRGAILDTHEFSEKSH